MKIMQNSEQKSNSEKERLDFGISGIPLLAILLMCFFFFRFPENSNRGLSAIRSFLGSEFAVYYLGLGLFIFLLSLFIAFSPYGTIVLGKPDEKPAYSFFTWGSMMFTAGLAADILFYSLCDPVSLGLYSLGLLSGSCGGFRVHASCSETEEAALFGSLQIDSQRKDGRNTGTRNRPFGCFCITCGDRHDLFRSDAAHGRNYQKGSAGLFHSELDHFDSGYYLRGLYLLPLKGHGGDFSFGKNLHMAFLLAVILCLLFRRGRQFYFEARLFCLWENGGTLPEHGDLYGCTRGESFSGELDYLLLGLLDGLVCGISLFYRKHQ